MDGKKILLVKTSSLGDLIHALPAISDVRAAAAGERIDWVVEQSLTGVPRLHAGVTSIIPIAMRRWRKAPWQRAIRDEITAALRRLRQVDYDAVIDAQGLFKSALVAFAARGPRYGLDFHSSREPLALFYHRAFRISWQLHAVERNRLLLARVLGYKVPPGCDYGITGVPRRFPWLVGDSHAVFLHATSSDRKLWPERHWIALGDALNAVGVVCVLPWGSARERERSERIAARLRSAIVPPALGLDDLAGLFTAARAVVGVDTGLTHLAAALGLPTVGIYCATDPAATGIYGCARAVNLGGIGKLPAVTEVVAMLEQVTSR